MASTDLAISVRGVSKSYTIAHVDKQEYATIALINRLKNPFKRIQKETFWALRDMTFDVASGEVIGIIGRNGAGKSTILKILSRITEPTTGEINLYGRVGSLLEVGTGFHPELTGRENIYLNGAILGMTRHEIDTHFDAIIDFADVEQFLDTPVKRYSSGMSVRLAFSVAAHLNTDILIVDEVLAVGDGEFQKKCLGKMGDVARQGRTVLFVSHNMSVIQQLCTRVILFKSGCLQLDGPPDEVVASYYSDALYSEEGEYDLTEHAGRSDPQFAVVPVIKRVRLYDYEGIPTASFDPDSSMTVEMFIDPVRPIRQPRAAFAVEDSYGRRIFTVASYFNEPLEDITKPCLLRCVIPRIALGTGRYLLSVSIGDSYSGLHDAVNGAAYFEVEWRNNYGNGEPYSQVYGPVIKSSKWTIDLDALVPGQHIPG